MKIVLLANYIVEPIGGFLILNYIHRTMLMVTSMTKAARARKAKVALARI